MINNPALIYKTKELFPQSMSNTLGMFLDDWVFQICGDTFQFNQQNFDNTLYTLRFENPEDALLLKLKGVPLDLSKYIEILH